MPLAVPHEPWQGLSMDVVLGLPKFTEGPSSVYVLMDRFSKMAHFRPCSKSTDAVDVAKLYFRGALQLHGLPKIIVSNRVKFTS